MADNKCFELRENILKFQEEMLSIKSFENDMKQKEKEVIFQKSIEKHSQQENLIPIRSDMETYQKYTIISNMENNNVSMDNNLDNVQERRKIANEWKEKGNSFVKLKNYESAIEMYSKAVDLYPDPVFYSNRSQCFLNLENYMECIKDATTALKLDVHLSKAYYRRMMAYEKLNENLKALQNCQEWMSNLPNDQLAKTSYDRIHNKIIEITRLKEKDKIKWSRFTDITNFICDKPLYLQSKKSLRKVNVSLKKSHSPIPDDVIDTIFNNNTGEHNETTEHDIKDSKLFKPNFLTCSYIKPKPVIIEDKNIVNEANEILKASDKKGLDETPVLKKIDEIKNELISIPQTGPQFYAAWKEYTDDLKFLYLKKIAENNVKIGKLLGAQLNSDMLAKIIQIVHTYFIPYQISYIDFIHELSKNSELSVLAMFLENEDKQNLKDLLNVFKNANDKNEKIQQIQKNFNI
ncbi:RNA polymerase II-associated protein 3-like isoform X2 [Chironomus tepperi]|uniref:RNA polymerase II-associated protein 3-like isoform X2 n=1 Tax=Chironomus tepperi TaxID=113505 RepID=UPI00391EFE8F